MTWSPKLYQLNRKKLFSKITDGFILLEASHEVIRNGDVPYTFRQESNFIYLTGIESPGYSLILDSKKKKTYLFIPVQNEHHHIWHGNLLSTKQAKQKYRADYVYDQKDFNKILKQLLRRSKKIHTLESGKNKLRKEKIKANINTTTLKDCLDELRSIKSPLEISFLKKANQISKLSHVSTMKQTKKGMNEYELQAVFESSCLKKGAKHQAYQPIVASGRNAAILHYSENNHRIQSSNLILIDAGCEWLGYAADITRTFPASGKFSKKQKDIYQAVLNVQVQCIKMIKTGASTQEIHLHSCRQILKELINLGIVKDLPLETLIKKNVHKIFYPHGIGHLLGLDVHDVGAKKKTKKKNSLRSPIFLKPGMVLTVEPGIYFLDVYFKSKAKRKKFSPYINWKKADQYYSIGGVRIEDDVLVTKTGHQNLTKVPKTIQSIEKIMRN
jgi:Xaa-Pro dipeptidase